MKKQVLNWNKIVRELEDGEEVVTSPYCATDEEKFLVSDGEKVYVAFYDHGQVNVTGLILENLLQVESRLTHWISLEDIPMPNEVNGEEE